MAKNKNQQANKLQQQQPQSAQTEFAQEMNAQPNQQMKKQKKTY